jgi:hypothetical protein
MENHLIMQFVNKLVNTTKYTFWDPDKATYAVPYPFYCRTIPDISTIQTYGCNCAGLINIIQLMRNRKVPGVLTNNYYAGGTYIWFEYLQAAECLEPVDINKIYPAGSLLIRQYRDHNDQGHVAVVLTTGYLSQQKLLHCYISKGITIDETVLESHSWVEDGYYEYICVDWFHRDIQDPAF